jgi:NADPH-dependent ferric siderophore reductase
MNPPKKSPYLLQVVDVWHLTPNMIRVTLAGDAIATMQSGCEGANCKVFLPEAGQSQAAFGAQLMNGPRPTVRTYTVRHMRVEDREMDIDFVDHGDAGPASAWARAAKIGSFCGFAGPGPVKVPEFYADRYLVVADMSALPVAAATLEAMPRDAQGDAFFEVTHIDDAQDMNAPDGVRLHWLVHPDPHAPSTQLIDAVHAWSWPTGTVQTCIAGESGVIKALRSYVTGEKGLAKQDCYISGYWKMGLIEDEHQQMKRAEAAA